MGRALLLLGGFLLWLHFPLHAAMVIGGLCILWAAAAICAQEGNLIRAHITRLERDIEALRASTAPPPKESPPFICHRCNRPQDEELVSCEYCGGCREWCCTCNLVAKLSPEVEY